jgi:hypothetical protein
MKHSDVMASAGKLELALKTFRTTWDAVDQQWADAAREDFERTHVAPIDPAVRAMTDAIARLAEVFGAAERQCDPDT